MIIGLLNIRWGSSRAKQRRISVEILEGKANIFLIQETKLNRVDFVIFSSFWPHQKVGWSYSKSTGQSGGLLNLWKEGLSDPILSFKGMAFLGLKVVRMNHFIALSMCTLLVV